MRRITIVPVTRVTGHGQVEIFLDEHGSIESCYLQVPELRGFAKIVEGMPIEEVPRVVPRVCGACSVAHHLAAGKAVDAAYGVDPPPCAKKLRELALCAHFVDAHVTHFYTMAAPDFVLGRDAEAATRNLFGVFQKAGAEVGRDAITHRALARRVLTVVCGRATHPVWVLPGGVSKGISEDERAGIRSFGEQLVEFAERSLELYDRVVLGDDDNLDLVTGGTYALDTHYLGSVDGDGRLELYRGRHRVVDQTGMEILGFEDAAYTDHVAEHVERYSFQKFPHLRRFGWHGFEDGPTSGIVQSGPLARLNAADRLATPRAQGQYERYLETLGGRPVKMLLASHWARLIELLYASERLVELASDPDVVSPEIRTLPTQAPRAGTGSVEAPTGLLTHHLETDREGFVTRAHVAVGTAINHAAIFMAVRKAAERSFEPGVEPGPGATNMIEMAVRAFAPCFCCATHSSPSARPRSGRTIAPDAEAIHQMGQA